MRRKNLLGAAFVLVMPLACQNTEAEPLHDRLHQDVFDSVNIEGFLNGGINANFNMPKDSINWGQQITDTSTPQFNQGVLFIQKEPDSSRFDYGFGFTGLLGSDADYIQFLGQTEYLINNRVQLAITEADLKFHIPIITRDGVDFRLGEFPSYNGLESIYAKDNFFYSHSYTSEFGPWVDTGAMFQVNLDEGFNVFGGIVSGMNTTLGWPGDNNKSPSLHFGLNFSLLDEKLKITAVTHSGPENAYVTDPLRVGWPNGVVGGIPTQCACNPNNTWRYYNNLMITYEASDRLTLMADINYSKEDGWNPTSPLNIPQYIIDSSPELAEAASLAGQKPRGASAYGIASYGIYRLTEELSLGARLEYWRDDKNFFANASPRAFDQVDSMHGFPNTLIQRPQGVGTSYLAATAGAKFTLPLFQSGVFSDLIIRPQARLDVAVNNTAPFFDSYSFGGKKTQGIIFFDAILPFKIK